RLASVSTSVVTPTSKRPTTLGSRAAAWNGSRTASATSQARTAALLPRAPRVPQPYSGRMQPPGDDWAWCPACRGQIVRVTRGGRRRPTCSAWGFVFFARPGVGAAAVVRDGGGRVLLVQRGPGRHGAGAWCLPCGFVEWGEDVRAAAAREAREEAGVEVEIGDVLQVASNFHDPEQPTIGVWFAAAPVDVATQPVAGDDAVAVRWVDVGAPPPL